MELMDIYQSSRSNKPICWNCSDSKQQLGAGMMKVPCRVCAISKPEVLTGELKIDKRSKNYKKLKEMGLDDTEIDQRFKDAV